MLAPSLFPKFEIRISKSETISKFKGRIKSKHKSESSLFGTLVFLSFDIVSCFGFRASNLLVYPLAAFATLREIFRAVTSTHFNASVRSIDTTSLRCQTRLFHDPTPKHPSANALRRPMSADR